MREKTENLRDRFPLGGGTSEIGRSCVYQGGVHCLEVLEQKNGETFKRMIWRNGASWEVVPITPRFLDSLSVHMSEQ